jgi:hypothetical protein
LCDLVAGAFARAAIAESYLDEQQRGACARTPVVPGDWQDRIRGELEDILESATLIALDPAQPDKPAGVTCSSAPRS